MTTSQTLKIACPSCGGHVEFSAELRGQTINCPHCDLSVLLELPGATAKPVAPPPTPAVHKSDMRKAIETPLTVRNSTFVGAFLMIASFGVGAIASIGGDIGIIFGVIGTVLFLGGLVVLVAGRLHKN